MFVPTPWGSVPEGENSPCYLQSTHGRKAEKAGMSIGRTAEKREFRIYFTIFRCLFDMQEQW
jgi:hypothetical protein